MASLAYQIVDTFEKTIAEYAGSKFAVAVESGTAALFLSCVYKKVGAVFIPKYTYPSVPASIIHAGGIVHFNKIEEWEGVYELFPYGIIDGALRFQRWMYKGGLHCLSFHAKKLLPIGRGGMILTNDEEAYKWFKLARFDGRPEASLDKGALMVGWNMYLTPEQAARGLQLFDMIKTKDLEDLNVKDQDYPNLERLGIYQ